MGTGRLHQALLVTAALAAVTLVAGCGQDGAGPLDSGTTPVTVSPEPTDEVDVTVPEDLTFPSDMATPDLADVLTPGSADTAGGIPVSDDGVGTVGEGDVVVDMYFDFMCPYCGLLDQVNAADLDALVAEGGVTVVYHPVSFLDGASAGAAYSTRAANAVAVVADLEPTYVPALITLLLSEDVQPMEGTTGLSDLELAQMAQQAGVSQEVTDQFTTTLDYQGASLRAFVPWTVAATAVLPANPSTGRPSTPIVLIDGQWFGGTEDEDWMQAGVLRAAVEAAKG